MKDSNPDREIENLLRGLTPAAPEAELMGRLRAARPRESNVIPMVRWMALVAAVAAAIVLIVLLPGGHHAGDPTAGGPAMSATVPPVGTPVESRQHLMEVLDLGVVSDASSRQPVRLIRTTWVDEILYEAEPGSPPRKEARFRQEVLPVSLTTY